MISAEFVPADEIVRRMEIRDVIPKIQIDLEQRTVFHFVRNKNVFCNRPSDIEWRPSCHGDCGSRKMALHNHGKQVFNVLRVRVLSGPDFTVANSVGNSWGMSKTA